MTEIEQIEIIVKANRRGNKELLKRVNKLHYDQRLANGHRALAEGEDCMKYIETTFDYEPDSKEPTHILADGTKVWTKHGIIHRNNGPAVVTPSGSRQYWWNGRRTSLDNAMDMRDEEEYMMITEFRTPIVFPDDFEA